MLAYRHAFHAGNHADVLKHLVLMLVLRHLGTKDKGYRFVDTHAGAGGYSLLGRYAKKNGEYVYNSPTDQRLVQFLGFDPDALLKELATGKGDGEMLEWVQAHSKNPRTPWEIEAWSAYMDKRAPDSDAETLAFYAEHLGRLSKTREDIKTFFEFGELDDYVSFGGKA